MKCSHKNSELIGPDVKRLRYKCVDCGAEFVIDSEGKISYVRKVNQMNNKKDHELYRIKNVEVFIDGDDYVEYDYREDEEILRRPATADEKVALDEGRSERGQVGQK